MNAKAHVTKIPVKSLDVALDELKNKKLVLVVADLAEKVKRRI